MFVEMNLVGQGIARFYGVMRADDDSSLLPR